MKAILCTQHGLPEDLVLEEVNLGELKENEVRIAVKACAVNFPDVLMIQDKYQFKPPLPFSPGGEVSGIIREVGAEVKGFRQGQRVLALCGWGGFAEMVTVAADRIFPIPDSLDFMTAASTLYTFGTAYHALKDRAKLQKGETLLVLGASGGVGLAAVELGHVLGAKVIAAASTDEKLAICKEKGATALINYEKEDLKSQIKQLTSGKGVDVVLDPVGGAYAEAAFRGMAWNGRYLVVGFAAGDIPKLLFNLPLLKGAAIMGVFWGRFSTEEPKKNQQNILELINLIQQGKIAQHIHKVYALEEAPHALRDMLDRKVMGKAMVKVGDWEEAKKEVKAVDEATDQSTEIMPIASLEDLRALKGRSLGFSNWAKVEQETIQKFAEATDDFQWIHVDEEKAKTYLPDGKNIAHGFLTLSLAPKLLYELLPMENIQFALNYGVNKVRFPAPLQSGALIRLHAQVKDIEENSDGSVRIFLEVLMEAKGSEKPVCAAEMITLVRF